MTKTGAGLFLALLTVNLGTTVSAQQPAFQIPPDERAFQLPPAIFRAQLAETTTLIRAAEARSNFHVTGAGIAVAVLDTGVLETHRDFLGRIVAKQNFVDPTAPIKDGNGHGTNVAGIVAANGLHVGIAPGADLVILKVLDDAGNGQLDWMIGALQWIVDHGQQYNVRVVNISIGDRSNAKDDALFANDPIRRLIATLRANKIAVVAAAGNEYHRFSPRGSPAAQGMAYPAIIRETVSVGAVYDAAVGGFDYQSGASVTTTKSDQLCVFSQRLHETVNAVTRTDVFAPGAVLTSAGINWDDGESKMQGTSQAAPVVAGTIALMQEYYYHLAGSYASIDDIEAALHAGGDEVRDGDDQPDNVSHTGLVYNRVDVVRAIGALQQQKSLAAYKEALGIQRLPSARVRADLLWSIGNTGNPDCPLQYPYPECIVPGRGRSCLMLKAVASAKANDCANAFRLAVITQCHNKQAQQGILAAGTEPVCNFLRTQ